MADINLNPINQTVSNIGSASASARPVTPTQPAADNSTGNPAVKEAEISDKADAITQEYGPVIASSSDGDTVRIKLPDSEAENESTAAIYDNSSVQSYAPPAEEIENFDIPLQTTYQVTQPDLQVQNTAQSETSAQTQTQDTSNNSAQIQSFTGYTDSQLRQLYLEGDISQIDYNQEVEAREARKEELSSENSEITGELAQSAAAENDLAQAAAAIDNLGSDDSSQTLSPEMRAQIIQSLDQ